MQSYRVDLLKPLGAFALSVLAFTASAPAFAQCTQVLTHSGANFQGGSFVLQAGFVEDEAAAASYTISPTEFPIKISLIEMIFGTDRASVNTVTEWEVFVYDGPPNTGSLVASYSSNDVDLPHVRIGPGTAGANIQFSVDPGDPEQIFVNNTSGTNTFSVGYRIVRHNDPPANPCFTSPNQRTNAFPSTDTNGLQQPSRNWLYAIDCGFLGAPAGWNSFASLPSIFRPTGDWNIRASYESATALTITDQPDSQTVTPGSTAVFQVAASGTGTLQYKWFRGSQELQNGGRIFGATSDSLIILNTNATDLADYRAVVTNSCGSVTSDPATLSFPGIALSGNVLLNDWTVSRNGQPIVLEVFQPGGITALHTATVALNASGNYSLTLPSTVPAGTYDLFAKGTHWLRKRIANFNLPAGGATNANFELVNGDVNNDNEVGPADFSGLATAFGSFLGDPNYTAASDLNGDSEVGPADFAILANSFGDFGD